MDNVIIKSTGLLYAGENNSDFLYLENFSPKDGAVYMMRLKACDGNVYIRALENGAVPIGQSLISRPGMLTAELCEKIGDDYIALSGLYIFPVFDAINDSENAPPTYEQAKSLAERAIEAADRAEDVANRVDAGIEVYYPEFTIDDDGHLIFAAAEQSSLDFRLNGNDLEVIING